MDLPKPYKNVMLTYKAYIGYGPYGEHKVLETVTRRAFYTDSDGYYNSQDKWIETPNGYFSVPQFWANFTFSNGETALLPHTFYSYGRVLPDKIISWKYDEIPCNQ